MNIFGYIGILIPAIILLFFVYWGYRIEIYGKILTVVFGLIVVGAYIGTCVLFYNMQQYVERCKAKGGIEVYRIGCIKKDEYDKLRIKDL